MRHQLSITINGQPRDEVVLATSKPLVGVIGLTVVFERSPKSDGIRFLRMMADESDFSDGAYRFQRRLWWPVFSAGIYRARGVALAYADGNSVEVPLSDEIVVDVQAPAKDDLPVFMAC